MSNLEMFLNFTHPATLLLLSHLYKFKLIFIISNFNFDLIAVSNVYAMLLLITFFIIIYRLIYKGLRTTHEYKTCFQITGF